MKELTSVNNDLVKFIVSLHQKKYRDENNLFIVEGKKALDGAIKSGFNIKYIFFKNPNIDNINNIQDDIKYLVNDKVMMKISTTESAPEVISVIEKKKYDILKSFEKIILLENIKDCGNLGTIIRSAAAFNVDALILFGDCCDLYSSKTVRASVGTFFQLPVFEYKSIDKLNEDFKEFKFISTNLHKKSNIKMNEISGKYVIMFGSEAEGLTTRITDLADNNFILPIKSSVESLNLATSVSIILYELSMK